VCRESPEPIYRQIADLLKKQIESGQIKVGFPIPPESELVETLQVSRVTVRQAIDLLVSEQLVMRKQGKGTFVRPPKIQEDLQSLKGLAELLAAHGSDQTMQVCMINRVQADERLAKALGLGTAEEVLEIKRRHCFQGVPVAVARIYLPGDLSDGIREEDVSSTPIYTLLKRQHGIEVKRAKEVISATAANRELASLLNVPRGMPLLRVERVTYSTEERPIEFIVLHHRSDSYEITVDLNRERSLDGPREPKALALLSTHLSAAAEPAEAGSPGPDRRPR
jgi:GntR family transcriptional regulator